jgi:ABC-2 type transport system ATP-binding protein
MSITFENIKKRFGSKTVLNCINLEIKFNEVYCILGRNGAGKSTLINIGCNLVNPDEGRVIFNEQTYSSHSLDIKRKTGFQSQYESLIDELNTFDYLQFIGRLYKMKTEDIIPRINLLVSYFFDNIKDIEKPIKTYSTGTKKKIMICAAFMHRPQYLFLDEPFASIDTVSSNALCKLINAYKNENRCIVISSHDLLYVNKIATNIGVIENGNLVYNDTLSKFRIKQELDDDLLTYIQSKEDDENLLSQLKH